jgi:hypothetical protein
MNNSAEDPPIAIRRLPGQFGIIAAAAASLTGWLMTLACLVSVVSFVPDIGWTEIGYIVVLCVAPQCAILATRHVRSSLRIRATLPPSLVDRRLHGNLDAVSDGRLRPLRSIGTAAAEVTAQTGALLIGLISNPGVHVFHSIRATSSRIPVVAHAVTAGRTVTLVESVAWPPGQYQVDHDGRLRCDGRYIGQSVDLLLAAVRYWKAALPRSHRVTAIVVIHRTGPGRYALPATLSSEIEWAEPETALGTLRARTAGRRNVSAHVLAALATATLSP